MSTEHDAEAGRKKLCQEIDQTLLEFFSTLTELYQEQNRLHQAMKSGFINMSRARYSMGVRNVGIKQCNETKMRATVKVIDDDDSFAIDDSDNIENVVEDSGIKDNQSNSNLRQRKVAPKTEDGFELIEKVQDITLDGTEESGDSKSDVTSKADDPLKWFGILVAPALRQCQKDFRSTADVVVSIANLQKRLGTLQKQYRTLMKQKKNMVA